MMYSHLIISQHGSIIVRRKNSTTDLSRDIEFLTLNVNSGNITKKGERDIVYYEVINSVQVPR